MQSLRQSLAKHGITGAFERAPEFVRYQVETLLIRAYNRVRAGTAYHPPTDLRAFGDVLDRAQASTDISDHIERLFTESLLVNPDTIVELGVRGGESTFVFERVARLTDADLVSVDIEDCSGATDYDGWHFVQSDDIELARNFDEWCADRDLNPNIDVLFIDTSHLYDHTVSEIDEWFPHLSDRAVVFFHDTNLTRYYRGEDGTLGRGWNNDRGVVHAIEDHFDCSFDESESFITIQSSFVVKHHPYCNGLAVLQKTPILAE
jgi:cephalosporin hydroxylase